MSQSYKALKKLVDNLRGSKTNRVPVTEDLEFEAIRKDDSGKERPVRVTIAAGALAWVLPAASSIYGSHKAGYDYTKVHVTDESARIQWQLVLTESRGSVSAVRALSRGLRYR